MNRLFADTSYFIALNSPTDRGHELAVRLSRSRGARLLTTEYVLLEFGNACSRSANKGVFLETLRVLRAQSDVRVIRASAAAWARGEDLFRRHRDKDWSFVDCTSFAEMRRLRVREALTSDHHFIQAGFEALLCEA